MTKTKSRAKTKIATKTRVRKFEKRCSHCGALFMAEEIVHATHTEITGKSIQCEACRNEGLRLHNIRKGMENKAVGDMNAVEFAMYMLDKMEKGEISFND